MDSNLSFVTDEKGNRYVVSLEIKNDDNIYYLTRGGVFEKNENDKFILASEKINEKYMPLLLEHKIEKYIVEENEIEL